MKTLWIFLCIVSCWRTTSAQEAHASAWRVGLGFGLTSSTSSDGKLNDLSYSGESFRTFSAHASYTWKANSIHILGSSAKIIQHVNDVAALYEYNKIERQAFRLTLSYMRRLFNVDNISVSVGAGNSIFDSRSEQRFSSLLYPQGRNYRSSYIFSPISVSSLLDIDYHPGRGHLFSRLGCILVGFVKRPGDNYVKQIGVNYSSYGQRLDFRQR